MIRYKKRHGALGKPADRKLFLAELKSSIGKTDYKQTVHIQYPLDLTMRSGTLNEELNGSMMIPPVPFSMRSQKLVGAWERVIAC